MKDITIEICQSRVEAELRKAHIKAQVPEANWKSRIIEDMSTLALFLTQGGNATLLAEADASNVDVEAAFVLIIWIEED